MYKVNLKNTRERGFTLVELMVTVGIFTVITGLLLARYTDFDRGIILTNLAYDVALTIRSAQSASINVKSVPVTSGFSGEFNYPFGVYFTDNSTSFISFADANYNENTDIGSYNTGEEIATTNIKRGSRISDICAGTESSCNNSITELNIVFKRPDPIAHIVSVDSVNGRVVSENPYAEITVASSDGSTRKVIVRSTGQISVR
jgi:prepilin-type N-terminal cleavage/methylation domain-containing protein